MSNQQFEEYARMAIRTWLDDGMEFCYIYENEEIPEDADFEAIRNASYSIIDALRDSV